MNFILFGEILRISFHFQCFGTSFIFFLEFMYHGFQGY